MNCNNRQVSSYSDNTKLWRRFYISRFNNSCKAVHVEIHIHGYIDYYFKMVARHLCWYILCSVCPLVVGKGIMLLYQPLDISNDCVFSTSLRYDLSFGMGLSDTISLVGNFNFNMSVHLNNFRKAVILDNFCH